ncbi:MAG TPA: putative inorganic carbon transporter subunit DabA, partial [Rhodocyclaceae bacterium]|nr:putative inorganic carbon transporter subunit DabA [Rhodocyclaceae bacterium]
MPSFSLPDAQGLRSLLHGLLHRLEHVLPAQAPIRDFVHHNTLHGFQHLSFRDALAAAEAAIGVHGYLPLSRFRAYFREGRIDLDDLNAALDETPELRSSGAAAGPFGRREVLLAGLLADFTPQPSPAWSWQVEELGVLERLDPGVPAHTRGRLLDGADEAQAVGGMWQVCVQLLASQDAPVAARAEPPSTAAQVAEEAGELWHQHVLRREAETRLAE